MAEPRQEADRSGSCFLFYRVWPEFTSSFPYERVNHLEGAEFDDAIEVLIAEQLDSTRERVVDLLPEALRARRKKPDPLASHSIKRDSPTGKQERIRLFQGYGWIRRGPITAGPNLACPKQWFCEIEDEACARQLRDLLAARLADHDSNPRFSMVLGESLDDTARVLIRLAIQDAVREARSLLPQHRLKGAVVREVERIHGVQAGASIDATSLDPSEVLRQYSLRIAAMIARRPEEWMATAQWLEALPLSWDMPGVSSELPLSNSEYSRAWGAIARRIINGWRGALDRFSARSSDIYYDYDAEDAKRVLLLAALFLNKSFDGSVVGIGWPWETTNPGKAKQADGRGHAWLWISSRHSEEGLIAHLERALDYFEQMRPDAHRPSDVEDKPVAVPEQADPEDLVEVIKKRALSPKAKEKVVSSAQALAIYAGEWIPLQILVSWGIPTNTVVSSFQTMDRPDLRTGGHGYPGPVQYHREFVEAFLRGWVPRPKRKKGSQGPHP